MKADAETIRLINACKARKSEAYKELYDRYSPKLFPVCLRYTHSREHANDVLHDAFVKIFEKIRSLRDPDSLEAWMRRITVNAALDVLDFRHQSFESIDDDESYLQLTDDTEYDRYSVEHIMEAISALPDIHRTIFNMHEIEGYEFNEIAKKLNTTESHVRVVLSRSKRRLRKTLSDLYSYDN